MRAWPDPKYFDHPAVKRSELEALLRSKAVLMPGVTVSLARRDEEGRAQSWQYKGGLRDYLSSRSRRRRLR